MTTTSEFNSKPDYYLSKSECVESVRNRVQTNPRYRNFKQSIFHAGDDEQFEEYRDSTNMELYIKNISLEKNIFNHIQHNNNWEGYKNIPTTAVLNTFKYIFNKFKKGIFVKIVNNKLKVFLPFSKVNYINEWDSKIQIDPMYKNIEDFLRHVTEIQNHTFHPNRINKFINTWYGNNSLIRYEYPINEGDTNVSTIKNMFDELCENRHIPDMEFFVNRRDFPILTKDYTEPYNHMWDSENTPLISHCYEKYLPILSMCKTEKFADILIPTWDDWARLQNSKKWFPKTFKTYPIKIITPWNNKKPTAVFRGSSTGNGVTIETNLRLKISNLSIITKPDEKGIPYLDAGITKWNARPRKIQGQQYLQTINIPDLPFDLSDSLTINEQSQYKYIVNIDGHVSAFRLSSELSTGSVVLLAESSWKLWFSEFLVPYEHYVPIKKDLSDLIDQIKWCRNNDEKCQQIASNALVFYNTYLQINGIFDYLQKTLLNIKQENGIYLYNFTTPRNIQISQELKIIENNIYPNTKKTVKDIYTIPFVGRSHGLLQGLQWIINLINTTSDFEKIATANHKIFENKLGEVIKYTLAGFSFAIKRTNNFKKSKEHIHETFVGTQCINNIVKYIPNFVYIFGIYIKNNTHNIITEEIKGISLFSYIKSEQFNMKDFIFIILQLCLALQVAQNSCCLVHYDLTPWNIMIQTLSKPEIFDYVIKYDKVIRIKTKIIPIIIDYGKSHVIHNNIHHGFINMYKFSTIQDILTLLLTSIQQISSNKRLNQYDFNILFILANFITNTRYRKHPFKNSKDLKTFLHNESKYSNLISSNKFDLENKTPMDLFTYITRNVKIKFPCYTVKSYTHSLNKGNSRQVFEFILSNNNQDRANTYNNVFTRLKKNLPQPKKLFFIYYTAQLLEEHLLSVRHNMMFFLYKAGIDSEKYETNFRHIMRHIFKLYYTQIQNTNRENINYKLNVDFSTLEKTNYDDTTFLTPSEILTKIQPYQDNYQDNDLSDYIDIIEYILLNKGKYKLTEEDRKLYIQNFSNLLNSNRIYMKNNTSNIKTLKETAKTIYKNDKHFINLIANPDKHIQEHLKIIDQILIT
jgi:hypothetical protein